MATLVSEQTSDGHKFRDYVSVILWKTRTFSQRNDQQTHSLYESQIKLYCYIEVVCYGT